MASLCCSPNACRHNYPLQCTEVWSKVKRVDRDCGGLTMTNDIPISPSTMYLSCVFSWAVNEGGFAASDSLLCYSSNPEADIENGSFNYLIGHLWSSSCGNGRVTAL